MSPINTDTTGDVAESEFVSIFVSILLVVVKDRFPPHIYYKVFTHRPIQDVGAFSPGDYTSLDFRRQAPRIVHNKIAQPQKPTRGSRGV